MMNPLFLSFLTLLLITTATATPTPTIGVTFDPTTPNIPPLSTIVTTLVRHEIPTVRLINPTPSSVHSFSNTNITLLISVPHTFRSFATDQSSSATWITTHILPFYNTTRISLITIDSATPITRFHLPALRNFYSNLLKLGIVNIPLSITFPLETILFSDDWFNPSQAEFYHPELIRPIVRFLKNANSSFLVNLYPYKYYGSSETALLYSYPSNTTESGYRNVFDVMVDSVVFALEGVGEGNVPVIVAGTGWPCKTLNVVDNDGQWAWLYLNNLMYHLDTVGSKSVDEVYVHELFGYEWGILDKKMKLKQRNLRFYGFEAVERSYMWLEYTAFYGLIAVCGFVLLQYVGWVRLFYLLEREKED